MSTTTFRAVGHILDGPTILHREAQATVAEERTTGGFTTWRGMIELTHGERPLAEVGKQYTLRLDDGRTGEIVIERIGEGPPVTLGFSGSP